jgi:antitoxin component YwqK of YwqJK toxin-antitoxin module
MIAILASTALLATLSVSDGTRVDKESYTDGTPKLEQAMREASPGSWIADGPSTAWFPNGTKDYEGAWKAGKKSGAWTYWFLSGAKEAEGQYKAGVAEGPWTFYSERGVKTREGAFKQGKPEGKWTTGGSRAASARRGARPASSRGR